MKNPPFDSLVWGSLMLAPIKDPPPYMKVIAQIYYVSSNEHLSVFSIMCCCEFNSWIEKIRQDTCLVVREPPQYRLQLTLLHALCITICSQAVVRWYRYVPRPCQVLRVPCECMVHVNDINICSSHIFTP